MNTHCHTRHCTCHMLEVKLIQTFTASTTLPSFKEYNNIWMTDFSWHRHENGMSGISAQPSFLQTVTVLFTFSVFRLSPQTFTCSCFLFSDSAHRPLPVHVFCFQTQPTDLYLFTFSVFRLSPQTFTCSRFLFSDSAHRPLPVHVFCLQTQPTDLYLFMFSVFRLSPQTFTCSCFLSSDSASCSVSRRDSPIRFLIPDQ